MSASPEKDRGGLFTLAGGLFAVPAPLMRDTPTKWPTGLSQTNNFAGSPADVGLFLLASALVAVFLYLVIATCSRFWKERRHSSEFNRLFRSSVRFQVSFSKARIVTQPAKVFVRDIRRHTPAARIQQPKG